MGELPPPSIDPEQASRAARSVLSERKYVEAARPPSLQERFFDDCLFMSPGGRPIATM